MKLYPGLARRLLLGAVLGLCAATALPQTPAPAATATAGLFTVEIVVFRNGAAGTLRDANPPAVTDDAVEVTLVPTGKLNAATAKLRGKNSGFKVLAHVAWTQLPTPRNSHHGVSTAQLGLGNDIAGKVILEREGRLRFGLDLTIEDGGHRYQINQMRSVKTNEINYFDHPAFGVLAIVSAVSG